MELETSEILLLPLKPSLTRVGVIRGSVQGSFSLIWNFLLPSVFLASCMYWTSTETGDLFDLFKALLGQAYNLEVLRGFLPWQLLYRYCVM